jgi:signal transduction histidine kinase
VAGKILPSCSAEDPFVQLRADGGSIFFVSFVPGMALAADIDADAWARALTAGVDESWSVVLYNAGAFVSFGADNDITLELMAAAAGGGAPGSGGDYFIASETLEGTGLTLAAAAPREVLTRRLRAALAPFIAAYALVALITIALAAGGSFFFTRPLHRQELALKNAEISALTAQISPHFLFNALNTAAWQAQIDGSERSAETVLSIAELLRANILSKDRAFVPLGEELAYARRYIGLQQRRFEGKFEAVFDMGDVPQDTPVPRFSIQPLIENAIAHGFEPLPDGGPPGLLAVSAARRGGGVYITVEDNGAGFPEGFDPLSPGAPDGSHTRVGLRNLRERLALLGGAECGLTIERRGGKTAVTFRLPGRAE